MDVKISIDGSAEPLTPNPLLRNFNQKNRERERERKKEIIKWMVRGFF